MSRLKLGAALVAALAFSSVPGCGSPTSAYIPNASTARESLEKALSTWQQGGKPDQLATGETKVHFVDNQWEAGKSLESYQIGEENPSTVETEKRYAVVLNLKKPGGEKRVEYIAVGRNPIWIFLDEDYQKQLSMGEEHKPKSSRPPRGRSGQRP